MHENEPAREEQTAASVRLRDLEVPKFHQKEEYITLFLGVFSLLESGHLCETNVQVTSQGLYDGLRGNNPLVF